MCLGKKIAIIGICLALVFCALLPIKVSATSYDFTVNKVVSEVNINRDGSVSVEYEMKFTNERSDTEIDIIDVGMSNGYYQINSVSFEGTAYTYGDGKGHWCPSTVLTYGIEVHLTDDQILRTEGASGTLKVSARIDRMIYKDDMNPGNVGLQFVSPYWGDYCRNHEFVQIVFRFPSGVNRSEIKHQTSPSWEYDDRGTAVLVWNTTNMSGNIQFKVGASFPEEYVDKYYTFSETQGGPTTTDLFTDLFFMILCFPLFIILIVFTIFSRLFFFRRGYFGPRCGGFGSGACVHSGCACVSCACACAGGGGGR